MMNNMQNIMNLVSQIKANTEQMLSQRNMNVPQNMMNDPNAIINYLLQTGQVNQSQVNNAYQIAQNMGFHK